jgi:hypothetical protein
MGWTPLLLPSCPHRRCPALVLALFLACSHRHGGNAEMINTSKKTLGAFVEDAQMKKQVQNAKEKSSKQST